ncbi:MAG: PqqD family protein [Blautia sp.]|nr:PqqD family protein [Blautia sp.]
MKLKPGFVPQVLGNSQFLVPVGNEAFSGVIRSNETAAFMIDLLREETTKERIIDAMWEKYDTSREQIAADVEEVLSILRGIQALDEG